MIEQFGRMYKYMCSGHGLSIFYIKASNELDIFLYKKK